MANRVVIIGAGHAGGRLALTLAERDWQGSVVLVGDEREPPYERPPVSKGLLRSESDEGFLATSDEWTAAGTTMHLGTVAVEIDRQRCDVGLGNGRRISYDTLVLATGARPRHLACPVDARAPCVYLRTRADAAWFRKRLRSGLRVAVIGGGVIGLEAASAIVEAGSKALVYEMGTRLMGRAIAPVVSSWLFDLHQQAGVELHFEAGIEEVQGSARGGVRIILSDGRAEEADFAVIGIGVVPNTELATSAGIEAADGVIVDEFGRTSDPAIRAIGDVARHPVPGRGMMRQETWRHAEDHARAVAASIAGDPAPYGSLPGFWSDQLGHHLSVEGELRGPPVLRVDDNARSAFFLRDGHLCGCAMLDNARGATMARKAIIAGATPDPEALADPAIPLKRALSLEFSISEIGRVQCFTPMQKQE